MIFAIGTPGLKLRMYFECKSEEHATQALEAGEVLIELEEKGTYTDLISQDGKSLIPYVKTPDDLKAGELADFNKARRLAYPPIEDQLDALWKGGADAAVMKQQIAAVKAAYPKPA